MFVHSPGCQGVIWALGDPEILTDEIQKTRTIFFFFSVRLGLYLMFIFNYYFWLCWVFIETHGGFSICSV